MIPTPPPPTSASPAVVPPTVAPSAELPTAAPPTSTTTPTASPILTATPPPATATAVATVPPAATAVSTEVEYRVAFVAANDVLNVRRQPSPNAAIVAELAPDATGVHAIGEGQTLLGGSLWLSVETAGGDGWVNSAYLTEFVDQKTFCGDPATRAILDQLQEAIATQDGNLLSDLVHPERGLRLRLNWWNPEIIVRGNDLPALFSSRTAYDWGIEDGSGAPIRGSFRDKVLPALERDLLGASEWSCDEARFGPSAGATILPEGYEAVRYFSAHRPSMDDGGFDWGTWAIGVERWQGRYYLSYLVHYQWEI